MRHNADLFFAKVAFRKVASFALTIYKEKTRQADMQRGKWLCLRAVASLRRNIAIQEEKRANERRSDIFNTIRLKLNVFRALAIHTLQKEKARQKASLRRTVNLSCINFASRQLAQKLRKLPQSRTLQTSKRTKAILKCRRVTLAVCGEGTLESKQSRAVQNIARLIINGQLPPVHSKCHRSYRSDKHLSRRLRPRRAKKTLKSRAVVS